MVLPMQINSGPVRLNEDEIKLASHLAIDRIYKEQLLDPQHYRLDEQTVTFIKDGCDSETLMKRLYRMTKKPDVRKACNEITFFPFQ